MKFNSGLGKKWRHGSRSLAITAGVLAGVVLINLLVGLLFSGKLWHIDLTSEGMYTLKEETVHVLDKTLTDVNAGRAEDDPVEVDIIFCADPDMLIGNERMRYVYYTALEMQKEFPDSIRVSTRDVWSNPSSVDAYRTNSYSSIYQSNVIVASGSEFRIYTQKSFYTYDTDSSANSDPWAYNGEKMFLSGIIAVTRAESPICALTVNHGEPFSTEEGRAEYSAFLEVIKGAGYDTVYLDLANEAIPENCRLIITLDPKTDFVSAFGNESISVSETTKLETFLAEHNSYMVLADADTPKLTNLEEFLEEWGIAFDRYQSTDAAGNKINGNYDLVDLKNALNADGTRLIGQYESEALGGSLTKNMRENGASPKVVFGNAMSISYSDSYDISYRMADAEQGTGAFTYGHYYRNESSRDIYDVFHTGPEALAYATVNGNRLTDADGNPIRTAYNAQDPFRLMTLTRQSETVGEGQGYTTVELASYVCAVGSVEFASNAVLNSNAYGNTDILLATLRQIGREIEPVGVLFKQMYEDEIEAEVNTEVGKTAWTVVLMLTPALVLSITGTVVLIKRRNRT